MTFIQWGPANQKSFSCLAPIAFLPMHVQALCNQLVIAHGRIYLFFNYCFVVCVFCFCFSSALVFNTCLLQFTWSGWRHITSHKGENRQKNSVHMCVSKRARWYARYKGEKGMISRMSDQANVCGQVTEYSLCMAWSKQWSVVQIYIYIKRPENVYWSVAVKGLLILDCCPST